MLLPLPAEGHDGPVADGVRGDPSVWPPSTVTGLTVTDVTGGRLWLFAVKGRWRLRTAGLYEYTTATQTWAVLGGEATSVPSLSEEAAADACVPPANGSVDNTAPAATPWPCPLGVAGAPRGT